MHYGIYAIPTISDNTTAEVKLFSVIAGTKAHSYAIIRDLGTITTAPNKLIPIEITNYKNDIVGIIIQNF